MADEKTRRVGSDRPEPAKSEEAVQKAKQSRADAADAPGQGAAPGRRPLFRN